MKSNIDDTRYQRLLKICREVAGRARSLQYYVQERIDPKQCADMPATEFILAEAAVATNDPNLFKQIMIEESNLAVEDMPLRRLRALAAKYKIAYYTSYDKAGLIRAIKEKQDEEIRNAGRDSGPGDASGTSD